MIKRLRSGEQFGKKRITLRVSSKYYPYRLICIQPGILAFKTDLS